MGAGKPPPFSEPAEPSARDRLDSWKEIAAYLKRDESTVRRWENEGLPVHRHLHKKKANVYAYKAEVDVWWKDGHGRLELAEAAVAGRRWKLAGFTAAGLTLVAVGLVALNVGGLRDRLLGRPAPGEITSIAVLPLENLSGDPEQEYFADGMTEALITELGKISALRVISRTSVMRYKNTTKSLPEIAQELNVDAMVEGAVVREGNRVRVTAQLIQIRPERHLWAERYEREVSSVLDLQSEVARAIAREIRVAVTPAEATRLARARPVNPEAYRHYVLGRHHWNKRTREGFEKAAEHFQQAVDLDPTYAPAYAGLADVYAVQPGWGFAPPSEGYPRARAVALKALELDESLAEAYATLGLIKQFDRDWRGAEQDLQRALELNPNYARAHEEYGVLLTILGNHEEAIAELESAERLEPLLPIVSHLLGRSLYHARQYDRAIQQLRKTVEMHPEFSLSFVFLGAAYAHMGMHAEALAAAEKGSRHPEVDTEYGYVAWTYAQSGRKAEAQRALRRLLELSRQQYIDAGTIAIIYVGLGQNQEALKWLERAYEQRGSSRILHLKVDPVFDPLRDDPRFKD
ncbi:MAG: tetratricopeptide repeat protein, partial [Acidobacteria bacterium]|nr:tetratricopeptide repeat protein [Acidobacteriota bacterium]